MMIIVIKRRKIFANDKEKNIYDVKFITPSKMSFIPTSVEGIE